MPSPIPSKWTSVCHVLLGLDVQQASFTFGYTFAFLIAVTVGLDGDFSGCFVDPDPLPFGVFNPVRRTLLAIVHRRQRKGLDDVGGAIHWSPPSPDKRASDASSPSKHQAIELAETA